MEEKKQEKLMEKFKGLEKAAGHIHTDIVFGRYSDYSSYSNIKEDMELWKSRSFGLYCDIEKGSDLGKDAEEQIKKIECIVERCYKEHEAKNEFYPAFYIIEETGDLKRISELCRKACSYYESIESMGGLSSARDFAEKLGDIETIKRIDKKRVAEFEKEKRWADAGKLAEKIGELEKAIEYYKKGEEWAEAGKIAEKAGQIEKVIECYEKEALKHEKSRVRLGYKGAAEYFEMAGDAAIKAGLDKRAMQLYEKAIHGYVDVIYNYAPHNILFIGRYIDAARVAEKMGNSKGAEWYRKQCIEDKRFAGF